MKSIQLSRLEAPLEKEERFDKMLFLSAMGLALLGMVMVYSSSAGLSIERFGNSYTYFLRHAAHLFVGCAFFVITLLIPERVLRWVWILYPVLVASVFLLGWTLASPEVNGVHRWIRVAGLSFQPAELVKLTVVLYLAYRLSKRYGSRLDARTLLPCGAILGGVILLLLLQPDLSSAALLTAIAMLMVFKAGLQTLWTAFLLAGLVVAFALLIFVADYRADRLAAYLHPEAEPLGGGFQLRQSLIAVGTGGVTGIGLGHSIQKLFFLPEPHTDFVYAIVAEELGFLGATTVLLAYVLIFWRGMRIASKARTPFGHLLAFGLTVTLVLQANINIGVVLGLLPTTGLPLPFFSYGGSSLLASFIAVGMILRIPTGRPPKRQQKLAGGQYVLEC